LPQCLNDGVIAQCLCGADETELGMRKVALPCGVEIPTTMLIGVQPEGRQPSPEATLAITYGITQKDIFQCEAAVGMRQQISQVAIIIGSRRLKLPAVPEGAHCSQQACQMAHESSRFGEDGWTAMPESWRNCRFLRRVENGWK